MTIGLDLTSLQGPHRMRGIGYTLINFINNIPHDLRIKHTFVFFYYDGRVAEEPLSLLKLEDMSYEVRLIEPAVQTAPLRLPGKLRILARILNSLLASLKQSGGDTRIEDLKGVDVFLQTDQMIALPKYKGIKKSFIAYDLIPYVLEWDYLWNYRTARLHGLPVQAAVRCSGRRWMYLHKLRKNAKAADKIFPISSATKEDFIRYIPASTNKMVTVPLGVNAPRTFEGSAPSMHHYVSSSWGYLRKPYTFSPSNPFLLFVGGADKRRKLDELIVAFNHLRGQGHEIKLVLAGDSMKGPLNISTEAIQTELLNSSYLQDIVFMGFVDDRQRDWLYKHALAFVFPSMYEGFGLPVLEAFSYGTSVIAYPNAATVEVAGDTAIYATSPQDMVKEVTKLLRTSVTDNQKSVKSRLDQAKDFEWQKTSRNIITELESVL